MRDTHAYTHLSPASLCTLRDTRGDRYTFLRNPRHRYRRTEFYYGTDDTGCLVCIDYRMHRCALRESAPIPRVLKRIACMRSGRYMRARRACLACNAYACKRICAHTCRFLSRIQRTRAFIEIRHRRSFRRQAAESRRRNNRVRRFFDLLEIESIARWSSEKCIYTAIEFHRVDCTTSTSRTHSHFDERLGAFRKMRVTRTKARN